MTRSFLTVALGKQHIRDDFSCGEPVLDIYIKRYARQDQKRRVTAVFVLTGDDDAVKGYYTLSATSIPSTDLSERLLKRLPRYPLQPATLLGRLAVDMRYQKQGLGEVLLLDALYRSYLLSEQLGSIAVVVDALNDNAFSFYEHYGFIRLSGPKRLFLPMQTVAQLFQGNR